MSRLKFLILIAGFMVFAASYSGPIIESDFFWHLWKGRIIWEGKSIPEASTQWLGQVILYFIWKLSGFDGIAVLRAASFCTILGLLFVWMRKDGVDFSTSFLFLFFPARLLISFPSERPQLFSFLFFPVTVYLLELLRKSDGRAIGLFWLLPPLVLLWANIHTGFILGVSCLLLYLLAEVLSYIRKQSSLRNLLLMATIIAAPVVVLILARPGTLALAHGGIAAIFSPPRYMQSVIEYLSPFSAARLLGNFFPTYWLFLAVVLVVVTKGLKRMPPAHVFVLTAFAVLSMKFLRFMPFFTFLVPLIALEVKSVLPEKRPAYAFFAGVLLLWVAFSPINLKMGISEDFPHSAVEFVRDNKPAGKVLGYQGWTGYLRWALPEEDMFMPVEGVTPEIDDAYEKIIWADSAPLMGKPQWRALLDTYGVSAVIMPGISPVSGEIFPIVERLSTDRNWYLVHSDSIANVFVREIPGNARLITIYSLPGANVYEQIIAQAKKGLKKKAVRTQFRNSLAVASGKLGLRPSPRQSF